MPHINGVTAKLRCRTCAGQQVYELDCQGPCGKTKPLQCFSKSQRTRGLKVCITKDPVVLVFGSDLKTMMQWCQDCVLWKESTEPGTTIGAAPGAELAPDEKYNNVRIARNSKLNVLQGLSTYTDCGDRIHGRMTPILSLVAEVRAMVKQRA